jgi:DNA-binding MarR family transcriptional regulator
MTDTPDAVDRIRERLAELYPELDTTAFGVTGRVLRLASTVELARAEYLAAFDLTPGDFDVLATIRRLEGTEKVNPTRLLQSVLITSGGLTKRLDRMEAAGLIARYRDPDDRRGALVRLTPDGTTLVDRALPSLLTMEQETLEQALTARQLSQTAALLRRIGAATRSAGG